MPEWAEVIKKAEDVLEALNIPSRIRPGQTYVEIDYMDIAKLDMDLAENLHDEAAETLKCFELALEKMDSDYKKMKVRIRSLLPSDKTLIREIRGEKHYGKMVEIEGRIKTKSKVRPKIVSARYECPACGNILNVLVLDDRVKEPTMCGCGRKGKFKLITDALEKTNVFVCSLQEPEDLVNIGSDLQTITCIFTHDLCDFEREQQVYQGCRVRLNGIIRQVLIRDKDGNIKAVVDHFFEVNHVQEIEGDFSNIKLSEGDIKKIEELASKEDALYQLSQTIFPPGTIFGYDNVKQALILSMFGGNTFIKKKLKNRGLIHVLLIGDPGAGKTDLMLLAAKHHPKATYINVAGGSTTDAGLNSTAIKDELTGEWTFSAGVVPMMHKGMIMIDEINELSDPQALQESLEQMTVTVRKANIQATLKAETTCIASCNPKMGRFDPFLNIYEQINMPPQLVNRFDLIFPFKDIRSPEKDDKIADTILSRHVKSTDEKKEEIDVDLIKKWIVHSQTVVPYIDDEIKKYMKDKYVEIRNRPSQQQTDDQKYKPVPISPRQLQAMIRAAQAYSKLKLLPKVTHEIAEYSVQLVIGSLELIGVDPETGEIDIQTIEGGLAASKKNKMAMVRGFIPREDTIAFEDLLKIVEEKGITEDELDELMRILTRTGEIFEPRRGFWKRM